MTQDIKKSEAESSGEQTTREDSVEPAAVEGSDPQASEVQRLLQQLATKEQEAKNHYDQFLRKTAELENFKKRILREKDEAIRFANETFLKDLLPVLDNLERAVSHAAAGGNGQPLLEGVELVLKGLLDLLNKYGVVQISALGQLFDPGKHEAMAHVESEEHSPNTVVEEHHKGYILSDRLLRPALVSVAKAIKTKEKKNTRHEVENDPGDD